MSFSRARQFISGLQNTLTDIPLSALATVGIPSDTTVLYGDGVYRPPAFSAPLNPAYDNSAISASTGVIASGTPFTFRSGISTSGAYGIVVVNNLAGQMNLTADVEVTWGGIPMVSKGAVYNNNVSNAGWSWVFELNGIPGGDSVIKVTPTLGSQTFAGNAASFSYLNVASSILHTAFGTGNPTLTVSPAGVGDIVWGSVNTGGAVALTGFSLTPRESSSTGALRFFAGDTTGTGAVTVGGTASSTAWSIVALDLLVAGSITVAALAATGTPSSTTFLRGDGTWNTPAGGGGGGSIGSVASTAVKTADYTASAGQMVPCDLSGGAFAVTLPPAPVDGTNVVIKIIKQTTPPIAPHPLTFLTSGSDVLNIAGGPTSGTMTLLNQGVRLQYASAATTGTVGIWYALSTDEPLSQLDTRYQSTTISPADFGWGGWSFDIASCAPSSSPGIAGRVFFTAVPVRGIQTITNLILAISAAGSGLTAGQCFAGLYQNGALLASTADQQTNWQTAGFKTMALSTPQVVNSANGIVYVAFFFNGTTSPNFAQAALTSAMWNAIGASSPLMRGGYDSTNSGRTTTFPSTLGTKLTTALFWAGWS